MGNVDANVTDNRRATVAIDGNTDAATDGDASERAFEGASEHIDMIDHGESDPIFIEEQAHLSKTYAELETMGEALAEKIARIEKKAASDKHDLGDEITLNATSFDEALETYAAFAAANRVIDEHNMAIETAASKLSDIRILLEQPYFAKIVIKRPNQNARPIYLGTVGMTDKNYKHLVVDWRSPVAEVYYNNQESGSTSYEANGRTISVDLELRRQFDLTRSTLKAYFDTTLAIEDPLLWEALSTERGSSMKAITATIQREQNTVIRHEDVAALLISGVAGSGKTSVLLQRIAYLFYRHRDDLRADQVFLLTPNPVFRRYIANVLPDLGESNPVAMTWREWIQRLLPDGMGVGKCDVSLERLACIETGIAGLELTHRDYREIAFEGVKFVTTNQVDGLMAKYRRIPMGPRRINLVRDELLKRFEQKLARMAATDEVADEVEALSVDEQIRLFHETVGYDTEDEIRKFALIMLEQKYALVRSAIERDEWLRIDRIGMRLLGTTGIRPLEWLFTNMCLTGLSAPDFRYVMVDEVQDYTPAQLLCLARYFRRAHVMMLGDENQALGQEAASFKAVEEVFRQEREQVERCDLMISYRSTPQITNIFAALATDEQAMQIESVHPDGENPRLIVCASVDDHACALQTVLEEENARIDHAQQGNESCGFTAIIVRNRDQFALIEARCGAAIALVDDRESLPAQGMFAIPLELAKGLEFDHVIISDASEEVYPAGDESRRRLYTAISRATKRLTILSQGELSPLLKALPEVASLVEKQGKEQGNECHIELPRVSK